MKMKKLIIAGMLLISAGMPLKAQETPMNATLSEATVFLQGAQLLLRAEAQINAGTSILKVSKLPPSLDPNSLQVKGDGNFSIQAVNFRVNYLDSLLESSEREALAKKLEEIQQKIQDQKNLGDILVAKDVYLRENRVVGGKEAPLNPESYRQLYELYCKFIEAEKNEWFQMQKKVAQLEKEAQKIQQQLNRFSAGQKGKSAGEVLITVSARNQGLAKFQLSFLVPDAGWYPVYDIRVDKLGEPINLVYKANVAQNTRMDWKNTRLKLSNARPYQSGVLPVLSPYFLRYEPVYGRVSKTMQAAPVMAEVASASRQQKDIGDDARQLVFEESSDFLQVVTTEHQTNVEFEIDATYTILSDGKTQSIEIQHINLASEYLYQAIPKKDKEGFLIARISDWEKHNLLSGQANLYFENTYVGKSQLNLEEISDTLTLSLGRDKSVVVSRVKVKDFTQKQFIGSNRIVTRQWEIGLKNNKKVPVRVQLKDQVPLSTSADIVVDAEELSGGRLEKESGMVSWDISLPPGESRKLTLKYSVKYPKDRQLQIE